MTKAITAIYSFIILSIGFGYCVTLGTGKTAKRFNVATFNEALAWAACGFNDEPATITKWFGGSIEVVAIRHAIRSN